MQSDRRHVAILVKDLKGGGVQKMRVAIARALSQKGYRVELLALQARSNCYPLKLAYSYVLAL